MMHVGVRSELRGRASGRHRAQGLLPATLFVVLAGVAAAGCSDHRSTPPPHPAGFAVAPVADSSYVTVTHGSHLSGSWTLTFPEYGYALPGDPEGQLLTHMSWSPEADGAWSGRWDPPPTLSQQTGMSYQVRVVPVGDRIEIEATATNTGPTVWSQGGVRHLFLHCFRAGNHAGFRDNAAQRTYARVNNGFVSVLDAGGGFLPANRTIALTPAAHPGLHRLVARTSQDGQWTYGMATDAFSDASFNFTESISCIHSNGSWPDLQPGQSATLRSRIYIVRGSTDTLWTSYLARGFEP